MEKTNIDTLIAELFLKIVCRDYPCGSQRCDGSHEWIEGCQLYQEFKKNIEETAFNLKNR